MDQIGNMKWDWSIDLDFGIKYNNCESSEYGENSEVGDSCTCIVD